MVELKDMSLTELKALVYDTLGVLQQLNNNLLLINQEIKTRLDNQTIEEVKQE